VKNKWVFKIEARKMRQYKARLVAKAFTQEWGMDYDEILSPVVRNSSIRVLLALTVELDLDLDHLDVITAFLNGDLEEEVYMCQAEGSSKREKIRKYVYSRRFFMG
jgi:hypothetical protein